jgi:acylphosphatase
MSADSRHPAFGATTAIIAVVAGRVQGVGFRYSTHDVAVKMGIVGWVRNRLDGTVEVWAQGPDDPVTAFARYLETGPRAARVRSVVVAEVEPDPTLRGFDIRY